MGRVISPLHRHHLYATVSVVKWSSTMFKVSFILKSGGTPFQAKLTLTGTDTGGGVDTRDFYITLN